MGELLRQLWSDILRGLVRSGDVLRPGLKQVGDLLGVLLAPHVPPPVWACLSDPLTVMTGAVVVAAVLALHVLWRGQDR